LKERGYGGKGVSNWKKALGTTGSPARITKVISGAAGGKREPFREGGGRIRVSERKFTLRPA